MPMHRISTVLASLLAAMSVGNALAVTFTTINDPGGVGADGTLAQGISGNHIVGRYYDSSSGEGFIYNTVTNTWTTIVDPQTGSLGNEAFGISGNNVVGVFPDSSGTHGFILNSASNSWTVLDDPFANNLPSGNQNYGTYAQGIDGNNVVGYYVSGSFSGPIHGFLYNTTTSTWSTLNDPSAGRLTIATGVSGNNVVGYYDDISGNQFGFLYNIPTNAWTTLSYTPVGIQGNRLVGYYYPNPQGTPQGFFYDGSSWITLEDPDAAASGGTVPNSIDGNTVVGYYYSPFGGYSGFLAVVPEPSGIALLALGGVVVGGFAAYGRRTRRARPCRIVTPLRGVAK